MVMVGSSCHIGQHGHAVFPSEQKAPWDGMALDPCLYLFYKNTWINGMTTNQNPQLTGHFFQHIILWSKKQMRGSRQWKRDLKKSNHILSNARWVAKCGSTSGFSGVVVDL